MLRSVQRREPGEHGVRDVIATFFFSRVENWSSNPRTRYQVGPRVECRSELGWVNTARIKPVASEGRVRGVDSTCLALYTQANAVASGWLSRVSVPTPRARILGALAVNAVTDCSRVVQRPQRAGFGRGPTRLARVLTGGGGDGRGGG